MPPIINKTVCKECGLCFEICPAHIFEKRGGKVIVAHGDECWHCNSCRMDCPEKAITLRLPLPCMMLYVDATQKGGGK
ncbi:MAG: ferredoxin family protein [Mailhella sp.]|nr:ferredoxin family protein [Mailhella sp.]MBQ3171079.1 ferredoxin family protein [Mailhella sp.]